MSNILERLLEQLDKRAKDGSLRILKREDGLIDFSSNDYLGLAQDQVLKQQIRSRLRQTDPSPGSGGSRLLTGNSAQTEHLEHYFARHFQGEKALIFNSGYTANLALMAAVPQKGDTIIYDSNIHACIKEGSRLSQAKYYSFRHNDPTDLQNKLQIAQGTALVVIESVYSMEGDWANLKEIITVCDRFQAELIMDEAHTTGWCGLHGQGWACALGKQNRFLARVYTFGKALGHHGACVVGSSVLIDYLINYARPFIYTTALPDTAMVSLETAWNYIKNNPQLADRLLENIQHYCELFDGQPQGVNPGSPIQWIGVKGNQEARRWSENLKGHGLDIRPILSPTVREGEERLRVSLHSFNTNSQIEWLAEVLMKQLP